MNTVQPAIDKFKISEILRRHGVVNASVFGSFARGDAKPGSDFDLLVTYKSGTTLFDAIDLQNELEEALGRKVDLISDRHLSTRLAKRIKKDIVPLVPAL